VLVQRYFEKQKRRFKVDTIGTIIGLLVAAYVSLAVLGMIAYCHAIKNDTLRRMLVGACVLSVSVCSYLSAQHFAEYKAESTRGTPVSETEFALHSVHEVVQPYIDGKNSYAVVRESDGSLKFVETQTNLSVGFHRFEDVTIDDYTNRLLIPSSAPLSQSQTR
jgi:hypothetical protein